MTPSQAELEITLRAMAFLRWTLVRMYEFDALSFATPLFYALGSASVSAR